MDAAVRAKVEKFLANVTQIPTLPDVYLKVKKAVEDPAVSLEYLADAIRYDQALTISILRLANSPFFGFRQKISSISQAIMLIGLREVYSLVLSVSIMGLFPIHENEDEELFPARKFWEHSLAVGIAARLVGSVMGVAHPEELFVAGLIHDIGKLIEKIHAPEQFQEVCKRVRSENRMIVDVEQEVLGFTHAEVGQILAETWKFPELLITTTGCHHRPATVKDAKMAEGTAVVLLADSLVRAMRLGWAGDPFVTPLNTDVLKIVHNFPFDDAKVLMGRIRREHKGAISALMSS